MPEHTDLIAKLEVATEGSRELDVAILNACGKSAREWTSTAINPFGRMGMSRPDAVVGHGNLMRPAPRLTTSLDAGFALIEEKLPGWRAQMKQERDHGWIFGFVPPSQKTSDVLFSEHMARHKSRELAACIALLKALEAQEKAPKDTPK